MPRILFSPVSSPAIVLAGCGGGGEQSETTRRRRPLPRPPRPPTPRAGRRRRTHGDGDHRGTIKYEGEVPTLKLLSMDADPNCAKKHTVPVPSEVLVLGDGQTLGNVYVRVKSGPPPARATRRRPSPPRSTSRGATTSPTCWG